MTAVPDVHLPAAANRFGVLIAGLMMFAIFATWSLATARYGGPDEPAHVLRAASVASGDLLGRPGPGLEPGYRSVLVPVALTTGDPSCFRHDEDTAATCAVEDPAATGSARASSSAGNYPPLYYALVGVPVRLLGDESKVLWYRLVAAFWSALALTVAAARSRRFVASLLVVCITPASWFLFGIVNPNALEIALAVVAWVGVERVRTSAVVPTMADVGWIAGPIAIAIVIRPVAALTWGAMVGVLVVSLWRRPASAKLPLARRGILYGLPMVAVLIAIAWNVWAGVAVRDSRTAAEMPFLRSLWRAIDESTETWREMAGSLGWLEFSAPWIAHVIWWSIAGIAAWLALGGNTRLRLAWFWVLAVFVAGPIAFEVVFVSSVGFIWQGRYSIPTGIGLMVVGIDTWRRRLTRRTISVVVGFGAAAQVATLWVVLQRYTTGADGSWWFRNSAWQPPLPPVLLLGADCVLLVGLLWIANRGSVGAFGDDGSVGAFGDLAPYDVERGTGAEPLDLLRAERVEACEIEG